MFLPHKNKTLPGAGVSLVFKSRKSILLPEDFKSAKSLIRAAATFLCEMTMNLWLREGLDRKFMGRSFYLFRRRSGEQTRIRMAAGLQMIALHCFVQYLEKAWAFSKLQSL